MDIHTLHHVPVFLQEEFSFYRKLEKFNLTYNLLS